MKKLKNILSKIILKIVGWEVCGNFPEAPKYVVIIAPHKSAFELLLGILTKGVTNVQPQRFLMKYELSKIPIVGNFLSWLGGVPVDRNRLFTKNEKGFYIQKSVDIILQAKKIAFVVLPEGTRISSSNPYPQWKMGFKEIVEKSGVPLCMVGFDYKRKKVIISQIVELSLDQIDDWYRKNILEYQPNIQKSSSS